METVSYNVSLLKANAWTCSALELNFSSVRMSGLRLCFHSRFIWSCWHRLDIQTPYSDILRWPQLSSCNQFRKQCSDHRFCALDTGKITLWDHIIIVYYCMNIMSHYPSYCYIKLRYSIGFESSLMTHWGLDVLKKSNRFFLIKSLVILSKSEEMINAV